MRKIILLILTLFSLNAIGQNIRPTAATLPQKFEYKWYQFINFVTVDSGLTVARRDTNFISRWPGTLVRQPSDGALYMSRDNQTAFGDHWDAVSAVGAGTGDITGGSNVGAGGVNVFSAENSGVLEFNTLSSSDFILSSNIITISTEGLQDDLFTSVIDAMSIDFTYVDGSNTLSATLLNDVSSPGNLYYYGTNSAGTKGWYTLSSGITDTHMGNTNLTQTAARTYTGAGFDYTLNNLGNWTYNVNAEKVFEVYAGSENFLSLGYSASGSSAYLGAQSAGANNSALTLNSEGLDESEFADLSVNGSDFSSKLFMERGTGTMLEQIRSVGHLSRLYVRSDSILFQPDGGIINIDSLRTGTSTDEILTWSGGMVRKASAATLGIGTPTLQEVIEAGYYVHDTSIYIGQNFLFRWDFQGSGNPVGQYNGGTNSMVFFNIGANRGINLDWSILTDAIPNIFKFREGNGGGIDTLATLYDIRTGGSIPTLQQVLDAGSTINTTESIILTGGSLFNFDIGANSYVSFTNSVASPQPVSIFSRVTDNTNSTNYVSRFDVFSTGTVANGFGGTIGYVLENASGGTRTANEFKWKFTNATAGSETSQIDIEGVDNGGGELFMNIQANGIVRVNDNADTLATKAYARSVGGGGGGGTVTDFIFTDGNGFDGTVSLSTSTPTLSLTTTVGNTQVMFSNNGAVTGSSDFKYISADNSIELGTGDVVAGYTDAIAMEGSIARGVGAIVFSTNARDSSSNTFMGAGQNTIIRPSANGSATFMTDGVVYGGATYSFSANDANEIKGESASVFGFGNKISVQNGFLAGNTNNLGSLSGIGGLNSYTDSWMIGTNNESTGDRNGTLGYKIQNTGQEAIIIGMGIAAGNDLWNSVRRRFGVGFNSDSLTFIVGEASGAGTFGLTRIRGGLELGMPNNDNTNDRFLTIDATTNMVEWTSLGAFTDENFAENDLTATANRTHDFAGFDLQINDLGVTGFKTEVTGSAYGEIGLGGKVASYMAGMIANFDANDYATMGVNQGDGTSNAFIDASAGSNYSSINVTGSSIVLRSAAVNLGIAGSSLGVLKFNGNTSGTITIQSAAAAGTYTLTLPANDGDVDQFLKTDGSGGLSWSTPAGGGTIGGSIADDQVAVGSGSNTIEGTANFIYTTGEILVGGNTDVGDYDLQIDKGLAIANVSSGQAAILIDDDEDEANTFGIGNNSGTQWSISASNSMELAMGTISGDIVIQPGFVEAARFQYNAGIASRFRPTVTTDIGVVVQGLSSQAEDLLQFRSNADAILGQVDENGYAGFARIGAGLSAGTSPSYRLHVDLSGGGASDLAYFNMGNSGASTGTLYFNASGSNASISVQDGEYWAISATNANRLSLTGASTPVYIQSQNEVGFDVGGNLNERRMTFDADSAKVEWGRNHTAAEDFYFWHRHMVGTNVAAGNVYYRGIAGTGDATGGGDFVWQTADAGSSGTAFQTTTEKMRLTRTGVLKLATVVQDDTETKVLVWNSTDDEVQWRDASTLGGGSGGHTIKEEGTPLTARSGLNFVGAGITAADDAGNNETDVTLDDDLNSWAGVTRASGFDTWVATPSSANLRALLTDESGTGEFLTTNGSAANLTSFPTFNQNTTGSAATLTTTRTIWGQNFNGSANVTGNLTIGTANLLDANGNEFIIFSTTASAVNEVTFANAATGNNPRWTASGGGTDIGIQWLVKGAGKFDFLASASGASEIRLYEDSDNGTNYIGIISQTTLGTNRTITLPDATGTIVLNDNTATLTNKSIDASQLTGSVATARLTNVKQIKSATIAAPTSSENVTLFFTNQAITITNITGVMLGTSQSITLVVNYGDSRATADGTIVASNTFDSGDSGYQTTGFSFTLNTTSIPAGSYVWLTTSATSGTINDLNISIEYNQQ